MLVDGIIWVNKMNDLAGAHRWIASYHMLLWNQRKVLELSTTNYA